jgi:hypothetical protein
MLIPCPHCGGRAIIRRSSSLSPLMRKYTAMCINPYCCHVWTGTISADFSIRASLIPNKNINLPIGPRFSKAK